MVVITETGNFVSAVRRFLADNIHEIQEYFLADNIHEIHEIFKSNLEDTKHWVQENSLNLFS